MQYFLFPDAVALLVSLGRKTGENLGQPAKLGDFLAIGTFDPLCPHRGPHSIFVRRNSMSRKVTSILRIDEERNCCQRTRQMCVHATAKVFIGHITELPITFLLEPVLLQES